MKEKKPWVPSDALKNAVRRNYDGLKDSAIFLLMFSEGMIDEVIPVIQMGLAVYLDKPIYLLVPESAVLKIPHNVRAMARRIEIYKDKDIADLQRASEALLKDHLKGKL